MQMPHQGSIFLVHRFLFKKKHHSSGKSHNVVQKKKKNPKKRSIQRNQKNRKMKGKNDNELQCSEAKKLKENVFVCLSTDLTVQFHIKTERKRKERPPTRENKDRPLQQMYTMRKSAKVVL